MEMTLGMGFGTFFFSILVRLHFIIAVVCRPLLFKLLRFQVATFSLHPFLETLAYKQV